jgi:hypothetical protein
MLLLLLVSSAAAAQPALMVPPNIDNMRIFDVGGASEKCPPISRYEAARRGGKLKPNLLDQLPMADVYKAVYRRVDGCVAPVMVKYGVGRR